MNFRCKKYIVIAGLLAILFVLWVTLPDGVAEAQQGQSSGNRHWSPLEAGEIDMPAPQERYGNSPVWWQWCETDTETGITICAWYQDSPVSDNAKGKHRLSHPMFTLVEQPYPSNPPYCKPRKEKDK